MNNFRVVVTDQFNDPVSNVKIMLRGFSLQEVYTATSDRLGIATFGTISGTFNLVVVSMPNNYVLESEEPIYVTVDPTLHVAHGLKLKSTQTGDTSITIYDDSGNLVPNVSLSILHENNRTTFEGTSDSSGVVSFSDIKVGVYRIVHTTLPQGYDIDYPIETPVNVYLNDTTQSSIVITKLPTSTVPGSVLVKVTKYSPTTLIGFENIDVQLINPYTSIEYYLKTNSEGLANFTSVLPGAYEVNVFNLPSEYIPLGNIGKVIVYPENQSYAEAHAIRSDAGIGSISIMIRDQINGIRDTISNLSVQITNLETGAVKEAKTNIDGVVIFGDLHIGNYNLDVIDQISGLSFDTQEFQNINVEGDKITNSFIWYDAPLNSISSKVVDQDYSPINNVEIYLLNPVTNIKKVLPTNQFGYVVFENIPAGTYEIGLVKIPEGYIGPKSTKVTLEKTDNNNLGHVYHLMKDSGSVILPISIKMFKLPNKIDYLYNEPLDLTGAQLEITYNDNSTQIIPVTNEMVTGYNPEFSYYGKNELTVLYQKFWTTFNIYQNRFKDVKHNYWAAEPIHMIADMGVITGYPDGTFKPGANVTRAEAIVMIIRFLDSVGGFELDPTIDSTFSDLPNTNWAKTHIMSAVNLGIISGYKDGTFKPNNPITRAELSAILSRIWF